MRANMTDTDRLNWLERTGANVIAGTSETLVPENFAVCVNRVTGWVVKATLREAIDEAERIARTHKALK